MFKYYSVKDFIKGDDIVDNFRVEIKKVFQRAAKSFYRFPISILSAIIISITAFIRISMDWEVQQIYNFLFDSIQLSFLLAAAFSMAIVVLIEIKFNSEKKIFLWGNIISLLVAIMSFILLYFFSGTIPDQGVVYVSNIANARIFAGVLASGILFVYFISKNKTIDSFSDSFFISHRAFIISSIYGLVIMIGVSGVLGAFQALVYRGMSYQIYQYLGVVVAFLTYTIFLGYFPKFVEGEEIEEIEDIREQPRFIYVLFEYILVPIIMALTVVLLIWSGRVLFRGVDVSFNQLSSIASSYVIIGIWLHMMVARHDTKMASFYKRAYPFSAILVLGFEAWALIVQLNKFGLKTAEYSFTMIWIFAIISIGLLLFYQKRKESGYRKIALTGIVIAIIWVLPFVGYEDLTFNSQVNRLENLLMEEQILVDENIVKIDRELDKVKMAEITDAVDFISDSDKKNTPKWFKKNLKEENVFKNTFGFEKTYGIYEDPIEYYGNMFRLNTEVIDISDYSLSLNIDLNEILDEGIKFKGKDVNYVISWSSTESGIPEIVVKLEDDVIIQKDLEDYLSNLLLNYTKSKDGISELPFEDMSVILEDENVSILIVFDNIDIYQNREENSENYYINNYGIYVKFKK